MYSFMEEHDLVAIDTSFRSNIDHTYERDDGHSTSWPDHFLNNSDFALCSKLYACPCSQA